MRERARGERERERPEGDSEREGARELEVALAYGEARQLWQLWRWRIGERERKRHTHREKRGTAHKRAVESTRARGVARCGAARRGAQWRMADGPNGCRVARGRSSRNAAAAGACQRAEITSNTEHAHRVAGPSRRREPRGALCSCAGGRRLARGRHAGRQANRRCDSTHRTAAAAACGLPLARTGGARTRRDAPRCSCSLATLQPRTPPAAAAAAAAAAQCCNGTHF